MAILTYSGALDTTLTGTTSSDFYFFDPALLGTNSTTISDGGGADKLVIYDYIGVRDAGEFENTGSALIWRNYEGGEIVIPLDGDGNPVIETLEWRAAPSDGTYRYSLEITTDLMPSSGGSLAIAGTSGDDVIVGRDHGVDTLGWNEIYANMGDDIVTTSASQYSYVYGGGGNDTITAGGAAGSDQWGDGGNDTLTGGVADDMLSGGTGKDTLYGGDGDDTLTGDDGKDAIYDGSGDDTANGGKGDDTFYMGSGADTIEGGAGNDTLVVDVSTSARGDYTVFWDMATGAHGAKESTANRDVFTGIENYTLIGEVDTDITGDDKDSHFITGAGWDTLSGSAGKDTLDSGDGNDILKGGGGNDVLMAGKGGDDLEGGKGNDKLKGGKGNDDLEGGKGNDKLTGGAGKDTFVFKKAGGKDTIKDFQDDKDTIQLDDALWNGSFNKQKVINKFAKVVGDDIIFDFGKHELKIKDFIDLAELKDDLDII